MKIFIKNNKRKNLLIIIHSDIKLKIKKIYLLGKLRYISILIYKNYLKYR